MSQANVPEVGMTNALGNSSWTPASLAVLERACDYFGGFETWRALHQIRLFGERLSGFVPWLKGNGHTFVAPRTFEIRPHRRWARFLSYPDPDHVGIFDNGKVRLQRNDGSAVRVFADEHRQSFRGLAMNRRWSPLDALYFFGYALTHYHSLPFSLVDARLIRATEVGSGKDRLSVLDVELPADLPTHCRRQQFYFNQSGALERHDYHAEIVGFFARGAHFWQRQTRRSGFPISLTRHVTLRLGAYSCPFTALHANFVDAEVELTPTITAAST
ncbi:MAG TPA: hypothetical protein VER96_07000 [Polyangiaceae bacterium]|nr:hypothetical protein [Polyangiaceae bacterium]